MLRSVSKTFVQKRFYVSDPFNSQKPMSETHATEKTDPQRNVQSDAVDKGMKEKKNAQGREPGQKQKPEETTRAPGPVIGMQDERGKSIIPNQFTMTYVVQEERMSRSWLSALTIATGEIIRALSTQTIQKGTELYPGCHVVSSQGLPSALFPWHVWPPRGLQY
jgi:hypothetical protein